MLIVQQTTNKKQRRRISYIIVIVLICSTAIFVNYRSKQRLKQKTYMHNKHVSCTQQNKQHNKQHSIYDYMHTMYAQNANDNDIQKTSELVNDNGNTINSAHSDSAEAHARDERMSHLLYNSTQYTLMSLPRVNRAEIHDIQYNGMSIQQILRNVHTIEHAVHETESEILLAMFNNTDYALQTKLNAYMSERRIVNINMPLILHNEQYHLANELLLNGTVHAVVNVFMSMAQEHGTQTYNVPHLIHAVLQCLQRIHIARKEHESLSHNFYIMHTDNIKLLSCTLKSQHASRVWLPACTVEYDAILVLNDEYVKAEDSVRYKQCVMTSAQITCVDTPDLQTQCVSHTAAMIIDSYIQSVCAHDLQILPNILLILGEINYSLHTQTQVSQLHNVTLAEAKLNTLQNDQCANIYVYFGKATLKLLSITLKNESEQHIHTLKRVYNTKLNKGGTVMVKLSDSNAATIISSATEQCDDYYDKLYNIPIGSLIFKQCAEVMSCIIHEIAHNVCHSKNVHYNIEVFMEPQNTIIYGSKTLPMTLLAQAMQLTIHTVQKLCNLNSTFVQHILLTHVDDVNVLNNFIAEIQKLHVTIFSFNNTQLLQHTFHVVNKRAQQIFNARTTYNNELKRYISLCNMLKNALYIPHNFWQECMLAKQNNVNVHTINTTLQKAQQLYMQRANEIHKHYTHFVPQGFTEISILHDVQADEKHKLHEHCIKDKKVLILIDEEAFKQYMKQQHIQLTYDQYEHFFSVIKQVEHIERYIVAMQHMNKMRMHFHSLQYN